MLLRVSEEGTNCGVYTAPAARRRRAWWSRTRRRNCASCRQLPAPPPAPAPVAEGAAESLKLLLSLPTSAEPEPEPAPAPAPPLAAPDVVAASAKNRHDQGRACSPCCTRRLNESRAAAKTIDLCNNPQTKEPKPKQARISGARQAIDKEATRS